MNRWLGVVIQNGLVRAHLDKKPVLLRRAVLGGLGGLAMPPSPARAEPALRLLPQPDAAPAQVTLQPADGATRICFSGATAEALPPITLPGRDVRLIGRLPLAGRDLLVAGLVASEAVSLIALIGWDGVRTRLLDLEPAAVRSAEGPSLSMRLNATPDGKVLRVVSLLSAPRSPTLPFHEQWIDMLGFAPQAPLADVAPRRAPPGTCQERLAGIRAAVRALLMVSPDRVTEADLQASGLLDVPHQLALALGASPYPAGMADP